MRRRLLIPLLLGLFTLFSMHAAESIVAFSGAGPGDLTRGLPPNALLPKLLPEREYLESNSLWMQLENGDSLMVSLYVTNLDGKGRSAVGFQLLPARGAAVTGQQEFPRDALLLDPKSNRIQFGRNSFERRSDGRYRLRFAAAMNELKGELTADLVFTPVLPPFKRGDGRVRYGKEQRGLEFLLLFPRATVEGHYTLNGQVVKVRGDAYGDHVSQNLWAHHIATRWYNYRFFAPDLTVASSSWTTPARYGSKAMNHVVVGDREKLLFSSEQETPRVSGAVVDPASGYPVPREVRLSAAGGGMKVDLQVSTPRWQLRQDILADVNAFLRTFIRMFIAKPYTYWYRAQTTATITWPDGRVTRSTGAFLSAIIFVNEDK